MKNIIALFLLGVVGFISTIRMADAADRMNSVPLPFDEGAVSGAAFSPDSSRLALIRNVVIPSKSGQQPVLQIIDIRSRQEIARADVSDGESASLASNAYLVAYSPDGHYILLATKGSDVVTMLDVSTLRAIKRFALHPEVKSHALLERHHYFRGVVGLAVAGKADVFGVLTHDALNGNEVFIGSFSSGRIVKNWSTGRERAVTQLGQISIAVSEDGSRVAVSALPTENRLPKTFNNLRIFDSNSGQIVRSIRTTGLIGQIFFISNEELLASRIDTPGLFSKKVCLEKWDLNTGTLGGQFCDNDRNVNVTFDVSIAASRVIGFASRMHKSIEGQVYAVSGRVDVWDIKSGSLADSSSDVSHLISCLRLSPNGEWVMADQMLLELNPVP